jgi:peptide/nickel transport system permease protein
MTNAATSIPVTGLPGSPIATASQGRLMWLRFRRHRLAVFGLIVIVCMYLLSAFAEVVSTTDPEAPNALQTFHPPQMVHFIDTSDGSWHIRPYAITYDTRRDPVSFERIYTPVPEHKTYLSVFGKGTPYQLWGIFPMDRHLLVPSDPREVFYLLGADRLGRDMLSRVLYGARITLSIGVVGVFFSVILGVLLGGVSGYYGGRIDWCIQRLVEYVLSLPTIPLWLALAAALPKDWSPTLQYFSITAIVSLVGWTELARVVRGRFLSMRDEAFVIAARLDGVSEFRIILRHMLPSLTSHIIAAVSLAVPAMILAESSLSFLGLGLQPPTISWGVLLQEAQNIPAIAGAPWVFIPGAAIIIAVISLNFIGDGMRDAADPYSH